MRALQIRDLIATMDFPLTSKARGESGRETAALLLMEVVYAIQASFHDGSVLRPRNYMVHGRTPANAATQHVIVPHARGLYLAASLRTFRVILVPPLDPNIHKAPQVLSNLSSPRAFSLGVLVFSD